jgi:hypothetical protein
MSIVTISDFDRGMITTLGGELVDVSEDGGTRKHYAIGFAGVSGPDRFGGKVPVFFVVGNAAYTPKFYPCVVIRRQDLAPAFENGGAFWHVEYRKRAKNAREVTVQLPSGPVTGYTRYETKARAIPYNIGYEVTAHAKGDRAMSDSAKMQFRLSTICVPPGFGMKLLDSEGEERGYDVIVENVSGNLSALDLTDRDAGWTWTLVVHGELDHALPFDAVSVYTEPQVTVGGFDPDA